MGSYIKSSRPLFNEARVRRRRIRRLVGGLSLLTVFNLHVLAMAGILPVQEDDLANAFDRLTAPSSFVADSAGSDGRRRYRAAGMEVRFVLEQHRREASVTFLCQAGVAPCGDKTPLHGERGMNGEFVFLAEGGETVLRVTAAGGATLFGAASFVPEAVPDTGVAVLPY